MDFGDASVTATVVSVDSVSSDIADVCLGGSVCLGGAVGGSVSAGLAVSGLPLSAGAVLLFFSFSAVDSSDFDSLSAGRLLSAVGSEVLSVTVAVMPLSVLTAPLSVLSFALSAPHSESLGRVVEEG